MNVNFSMILANLQLSRPWRSSKPRYSRPSGIVFLLRNTCLVGTPRRVHFT